MPPIKEKAAADGPIQQAVSQRIAATPVVRPGARCGGGEHHGKARTEGGTERHAGFDTEKPERPELDGNHQEPAAHAEEP